MRLSPSAWSEWEVGPVGFGPADSGPALGMGWMNGQGLAVWLWRHVFTIGSWPLARDNGGDAA